MSDSAGLELQRTFTWFPPLSLTVISEIILSSVCQHLLSSPLISRPFRSHGTRQPSSETVSVLTPVPFQAYRGESPLGIGERLPTVHSLALEDAVPSGPHCGIKYSGGLCSLIFYIESACSLTPACSFSLVPSAKTTQAFPHCLVWANSIIFLLSPWTFFWQELKFKVQRICPQLKKKVYLFEFNLGPPMKYALNSSLAVCDNPYSFQTRTPLYQTEYIPIEWG